MTTYQAITESGHRILIHGARARARYRQDVDRGDAERLIRVVAIGLARDDHQYRHEQGQCDGPCCLTR